MGIERFILLTILVMYGLLAICSVKIGNFSENTQVKTWEQEEVEEVDEEASDSWRPSMRSGECVPTTIAATVLPLEQKLVLTPPPYIPTYEIHLMSSKVVAFSSSFHFLSNLFPVRINVNGNDYASVEHYYQATKLYMLIGPQVAGQLRMMNSPQEARALAHEILIERVHPEQIESWKRKEAPRILLHAISEKFLQNVDLAESLLGTSTSLLAYTNERDGFFGTQTNDIEFLKWMREYENCTFQVPSDLSSPENIPYVPLIGSGKNVLGFICMQVRSRLRQLKSPSSFENNQPSYTVANSQKFIKSEVHDEDYLYVS